MLPGGLCRSLYSGARKGLRWLLMLVAHTSSPMHFSNAFLSTFLVLSKASSICPCNFVSLLLMSWIVSISKSTVHPHQLIAWAN